MLLKRYFLKRGIAVGFVACLLLTSTLLLDIEVVEYIVPESVLSSFSLTEWGPNASHPACRCWYRNRSWKDNLTSSHLRMPVPGDNNNTVLEDILQHHPNLPLSLLNGDSHNRCYLLPSIFSIEWNNRLWQEATLRPNEKIYLYSAFYDPASAIRLLGVSQSKSPSHGWCQVWFDSHSSLLVVKVSKMVFLDYRRRTTEGLVSYLITCPLPSENTSIPVAVSLSSGPCKRATNLLRVIGAKKREVSAYRSKKIPDNPSKVVRGWTAAVCGPALFYYHQDFSSRLVEWLELLRSQGFSRVFLYVTDVHPNITKVLHHYTQEGFVHVTHYTYPPPYVNEPVLRRLWVLVERVKMFAQENIYFTDCLLRHMHQYRFLVHIDPDEMIIPLKHDNFTHLLDDIILKEKRNPPPHGYKFIWRMFYSNMPPSNESAALPDNLWILRHTACSSEPNPSVPPGRYKPIYDMNVVRGVFSHGSLECVSGECSYMKMKVISTDTAVMGHFRSNCNKICQKNIKHDLTLLKYKDEVSNRVQKVLMTLNLL